MATAVLDFPEVLLSTCAHMKKQIMGTKKPLTRMKRGQTEKLKTRHGRETRIEESSEE